MAYALFPRGSDAHVLGCQAEPSHSLATKKVARGVERKARAIDGYTAYATRKAPQMGGPGSSHV